jgi:hypothetical protein
MRRSPLVALLLTFSFALQLVLARDGTTCVMPAAEHDGMTMPMVEQAAPGMSGMDMAADGSPDGAPQKSSCDHESAATACLVMAPCASGFVAIAAIVDDDAGVLPERIVVATLLMPPSRTTPPEPPPPRA